MVHRVQIGPWVMILNPQEAVVDQDLLVLHGRGEQDFLVVSQFFNVIFQESQSSLITATSLTWKYSNTHPKMALLTLRMAATRTTFFVASIFIGEGL